MCFEFFLLRLSSRHLKNRERWLAPRSCDRKILVPRSPALPEYTSLFFQILAKFTVTTVLVSTGVLLVLLEVDLFLRLASFFFVRFRNSFVARENSVFFNSMSRFSLTILIKWSVGFSFSSPLTTSIFCFSILSSVFCFACNFLISSACILNCCSWAITAPRKHVISCCWLWMSFFVALISALISSICGLTVAMTCIANSLVAKQSTRSCLVSSGVPNATVPEEVGLSAIVVGKQSSRHGPIWRRWYLSFRAVSSQVGYVGLFPVRPVCFSHTVVGWHRFCTH